MCCITYRHLDFLLTYLSIQNYGKCICMGNLSNFILKEIRTIVVCMHVWCIHIQVPPTGYVGLILCSTTVATQVAVLLRVLCGYSDATVTKGWAATAHAVAAEYPHSTLNGTVTCSSHSSTAYYETYVAGSGGIWMCIGWFYRGNVIWLNVSTLVIFL